MLALTEHCVFAEFVHRAAYKFCMQSKLYIAIHGIQHWYKLVVLTRLRHKQNQTRWALCHVLQFSTNLNSHIKINWYVLPATTRHSPNPMPFQCWASVEDGGPTLKQHWLNVSIVKHETALGECIVFSGLDVKTPTSQSSHTVFGTMLIYKECWTLDVNLE